MEIKVITGAIDGHEHGEVAEYPDGLAEKLVALGLAEPARAQAGEPPSAGADAEAAGLEGMKLDELKELCREMGLPASGKKDELIGRIAAAESEGAGGEEPEDDEPPALNAEVPR